MHTVALNLDSKHPLFYGYYTGQPCVSQHSHLRTWGLCWCKKSFSARMPLPVATAAFGLGRHWSSPQQCYLSVTCLCTWLNLTENLRQHHNSNVYRSPASSTSLASSMNKSSCGGDDIGNGSNWLSHLRLSPESFIFMCSVCAETAIISYNMMFTSYDHNTDFYSYSAGSVARLALFPFSTVFFNYNFPRSSSVHLKH